MFFGLSACLAVIASSPIKVAATPLNFGDVSAAHADFYTELLSDRLADQGLDVTSPREVMTLLGLERQRALLGCEEQSTCLTEIASALGVDAVVVGDLARVGATFQMTLKILKASSGKRLASFTAVAKSEEEFAGLITSAAEVMANQLKEALGRPSFRPAVKSARGGWWIPGVAGVLAAGLGTFALGSAENARVRLTQETFERNQAEQLLALGQRDRTLGFIGVGVGLAAIGTSLVLLAIPESSVVPTVNVTTTGGSVGAKGSF
jgi:hypothetical protein